LTDALLQCGDPGDTGSGGPTYQYVDENLPVEAAPAPDPSATPSPGATENPNAGKGFYSRGTVATWNVGPGTNGSQFFIVYKDTYLDPRYSRFGTVTKGMEFVDNIAKEGAFDGEGKPTTDGRPKTDVIIQSLTIGEIVPPSPEPTPGLDIPSEDPEETPSTPAPSNT
jgi:peptidyl-prolyl cis-trans isomerase B (cyclophilin B)